MDILLTIKKKIKNSSTGLWPFIYALKQYIIINVSFFYPQLFNDVKKLCSHDKIFDYVTKEKGKNILFFAVRQDKMHITWEFVIAQALRLRGHSVDYIACNGLIQKCCNEWWYPELKDCVCTCCNLFAKKFYNLAKFDVKWLADYCTSNEIIESYKIIESLEFSDYKHFQYRGLPLGRLARPSVCHFIRAGDIELNGACDPTVRQIYKNFLSGAVMMTHVCERILSQQSPEVIVMLNGLFISERIMLELARKNNTRTVIIECGLRPDTLVFLHNHVIDYSKVDGWGNRKLVPLSDNEEGQLQNYLLQRREGGGQTADYWNKLDEDKGKIYKDLCLGEYNKIVLLFPNMTWDSAVYGLNIMFTSVHDWVSKTISYFERNPQVCLIIRTHPGDTVWTHAMRDSVFTWVETNFRGKLPKNVKLISPDSKISSYTLMEICDVALVYASTTGLEVALMGKPVVVVGKVHYWNKGFTNDPKTEKEYYQILDKFLFNNDCNKSNYVDVEIAKRYAYFCFFETSFYLKFVCSDNYRSIPKLEFSSYEELLPGKDKVLDTICDGIVEGKPFIVN